MGSDVVYGMLVSKVLSLGESRMIKHKARNLVGDAPIDALTLPPPCMQWRLVLLNTRNMGTKPLAVPFI